MPTMIYNKSSFDGDYARVSITKAKTRAKTKFTSGEDHRRYFSAPLSRSNAKRRTETRLLCSKGLRARSVRSFFGRFVNFKNRPILLLQFADLSSKILLSVGDIAQLVRARH